MSEGRPFLLEQDIVHNPNVLFDQWYKEQEKLSPKVVFDDGKTVALTTCVDNKPSTRMLQLKSYDKDGFVFCTSYNSRKGRELDANPNAFLLFFWPKLHRQVRVEGQAVRISEELAQEFWKTRPISARITCTASQQSEDLLSREELLQKTEELEKLVEERGEDAVPKPDHWGGYILKPEYFEFWQGQTNRLHDRIIFTRAGEDAKEAEKGWFMKRICP
uniref:pyridoxal 5'-phosphate synthase n=1 Tax=Steinernema glaseri TaxID=37863 RepID=A0A1I7ZCU0_9BILA